MGDDITVRSVRPIWDLSDEAKARIDTELDAARRLLTPEALERLDAELEALEKRWLGIT